MSARHPYLSKMANNVGQRIVHKKEGNGARRILHLILQSLQKPLGSQAAEPIHKLYSLARRKTGILHMEFPSASCKKKRAANYRNGNKMEGW